MKKLISIVVAGVLLLIPQISFAKPPDYYCFWEYGGALYGWVVYDSVGEACGYMWDEAGETQLDCGPYGGCPGWTEN